MSSIEEELRHTVITDKNLTVDAAARLSLLDPVICHLCAIIERRYGGGNPFGPQPPAPNLMAKEKMPSFTPGLSFVPHLKREPLTTADLDSLT